MLNKATRIKIISVINDIFNECRQPLDDYLCNNCSTLVQKIDYTITEDIIYESIGDVNSIEYTKFIKLMINELKGKKPSPRVSIEEYNGLFYIEKTTYGNNTSLNIIQTLNNCLDNLSNSKDAAILYEKLCGEFLIDCGFENIKSTPVSNDLGVDIIGEYKIGNAEHFVPSKINILVQVKYYNSQIDTSYLRKIIGDSMFIKFQPDSYQEINHAALSLYLIAHQGFTKNALKFANEAGIILITTKQILEFISIQKNPYDTRTYKFLEELSKTPTPL